MYSHWWTSILLSRTGEKDEDTKAVCLLVSTLSVCGMCAWSCIRLYMYMWCMCVLHVCAYWEYIFSLAVGRTWRDMELQYPQLSGSVGYFPLTLSNAIHHLIAITLVVLCSLEQWLQASCTPSSNFICCDTCLIPVFSIGDHWHALNIS